MLKTMHLSMWCIFCESEKSFTIYIFIVFIDIGVSVVKFVMLVYPVEKDQADEKNGTYVEYTADTWLT